jgi:quercetin dioxygenase-like cupin family protein
MNMSEIKSNESTQNRPEGDRILDAPYVFIDIPDYISQLKSEKSWMKNDRNGITVFKSEKITLVLTALKSDAVVKDYSINGFSTIQVLEGEIKIETDEKAFRLANGQNMAFHPDLIHSIVAVSNAVILQTSFLS